MIQETFSYPILADDGPVVSCIHECLDAFTNPTFYDIWVRQPTPENLPLQHDRYTSGKYSELNRRALGAIDGTHIPAIPSDDEAGAYRNRKGFLSFNVLCCATFDGLICFAYAGWEGSAHDQTVLNAALDDHLIRIPDGWYYLADAGYTFDPRFLIPYPAVRYHLAEQGAPGVGA